MGLKECLSNSYGFVGFAGSFSRSVVNYMAGCQTAVSNIVMSMIVLLTSEFITPLLKYLPMQFLQISS